jgi:catechol 2,3-dioxygenase-like lactoylglutathione lyase family enzyme
MSQRISRIELISTDPEKLADFYQMAFGFIIAGQTLNSDTPGLRAKGVVLRLGEQDINLLAIEPEGQAYPRDVQSWSPLFQHMAIVVADMNLALARLSSIAGWTAISIGGPQLLPPSSGGVTAFKFRDCEGHPLEFLAFPQGLIPEQWQEAWSDTCLGIDHSAISVSHSAQSIAFYEELGFLRGGRSENRGPEQSALDDLPDAVVDVTALTFPRRATPHVELLCYRGDFGIRRNGQAINDIAATRLVVEVDNAGQLGSLCDRHAIAVLSGPVKFADGSLRALLRDPDGHLICLETASLDQHHPPVAKPG